MFTWEAISLITDIYRAEDNMAELENHLRNNCSPTREYWMIVYV